MSEKNTHSVTVQEESIRDVFKVSGSESPQQSEIVYFTAENV